MVQIKSLREELKSLGLLQESVEAPAAPARITNRKVMTRKQDAHKLRTRIESLTAGYAPKKAAPVSTKQPVSVSKIKRLMEEIEELTGEPTEPEGEKAQRIMKDVQEIAQAVMKKYGEHDEVKEVFEALAGAADALGKRMSESEMAEPEAEKEVKKVVAELVDALEWLLEEYEPVAPGSLQHGSPGDPAAPALQPNPEQNTGLPAQAGAGAPAESRK